jgi:hypothetical protein
MDPTVVGSDPTTTGVGAAGSDGWWRAKRLGVRESWSDGMRSSEVCHCSYSTVNLVFSQLSDRDPMTLVSATVPQICYIVLLQYCDQYFFQGATVSTFR